MARYLSWLFNGALFVLCCFLVADSTNAVFAAWLAPEAREARETLAAAPLQPRTWSDRQVILSRNLFNASLIAPPAPPPPEQEDLEAAKIPMDLLGTVASADARLAWAAVKNRKDRKTLVVRVNDLLAPQVKVTRIERKRIVVLENDVSRELILAEKSTAFNAPPPVRMVSASKTKSAKRRAPGAARRARERREAARARATPTTTTPARQPAETSPPATSRTKARNLRTPASLFSQASLQPRFQDGEMRGVEVSSIESGSLFEQIGMADGDVITELNGIKIDSPEESARILMELVDAKEFKIKVEGANGPRELSYTAPEGG